MNGLVFLATDAAGLADAGSGGFGNIWQSLGGLVVVFGLLILSLKLMGRFNRRNQSAETQLLAVWHIGQRREIQVLRLGVDVHYIYRHDGAMVLLKQESIAEWDALKARLQDDEAPVAKISSLLSGKLSLARG